MVYSNKFVMAVLLNGEPQKELANGVVKLPFGAEYTLRFRNKNSRRAVVKIFIDGENVSGGGYVIPANDFVDIKRHHDKDRAFKWVDLDSPDAVEHGKNGPNHDKQKGVIEARFYLEKEYKINWTPPVEHHHHHHHHTDHHHHYPRPRPWYDPYRLIGCGDSTPHFSTCDSSVQSDEASKSYSEIAKGGTANDQSDVAQFKRISTQHMNRTVRRGAGGASAGGAQLCGMGSNSGFESLNLIDSAPSFSTAPASSGPELKDGCTVEGTMTGQNFHTTFIDYETDFVSLKVFLQGYTPETQTVAEPPVAARETNKGKKLKDLEAENEELRRKLAEAENEKLKAQLHNLEEKPKKKAAPKKKKTKVEEA
jgi:hypothetical protein